MYKEFTIRNVIVSFSLFWLGWLCICCYILTYYGLTWEWALLDAFINISLLTLTTIAVFNTIKFYRPTRGNLLYARLWSFLHALVITAAHGWLVAELSGFHQQSLLIIEQGWPLRYVFNFVMIAITTTAIIIYYYLKEENEKEQRKDDAEKLAKETELIKLRQQLQPHFLFNSLNSISALAGSKPEQARKMIQQLSDFLRGTLRKDELQLVSLKEELEHLNLYLEIEKVRFGHRLNTHIECDEIVQKRVLPSLLLQPIVENAIKFGLYDTTDKVEISIAARVENNELIVQVINPYDAATAIPRKGTGFGLSSVNRRLYLLYGRTDLLKTHPTPTHFTTIIHIPQT